MFRFIYKTTNTTNGMYYIGMHRTDNIDDRYLGSGVALLKALNPDNRGDFYREILEYADSDEELRSLERAHVTPSVVADTMSYNLMVGGCGRVSYGEACNFSEEGLERLRESGRRYVGENNPFFGRVHTQYTITLLSRNQSERTGELNQFYGKSHTEESKQKMSYTKMGKNKHNTPSVTLGSWKRSKGWWCTPEGCFISDREASEFTGINRNSIRYWCKAADEVVPSRYQIPEKYHGRTWRENGFYFVAKP